jgi:hypothetical protein
MKRINVSASSPEQKQYRTPETTMQPDSVSLFDFTFSSGDLVFAAAILLALAALLLVFSGRRKIALQESLVTEELLILLSRIADALEIQAARTPEKLISDLTSALKQPNAFSPDPAPPIPTPQRQTRPDDSSPMRFPLYNGEIPQDR